MRNYGKIISICSMLMLAACVTQGEYPVWSIKIRPSSTEVPAKIASLLEKNGYQRITDHQLEGKTGYLPGEGQVEVYRAYRLKDSVEAIVARPLDLAGGTYSQTSSGTILKDAQYIPSVDGRFSVVITDRTKRGAPFSPAARESFEGLITQLKSTFGDKRVEVPANWGDAIIFYMKDGQILRQESGSLNHVRRGAAQRDVSLIHDSLNMNAWQSSL